jgi:hypothetical protein
VWCDNYQGQKDKGQEKNSPEPGFAFPVYYQASQAYNNNRIKPDNIYVLSCLQMIGEEVEKNHEACQQ